MSDLTPEAPQGYPYHENPLLVDALEFAHQRALVGLIHTAPYWRDCEFFPCNAYAAIEAATVARHVRETGCEGRPREFDSQTVALITACHTAGIYSPVDLRAALAPTRTPRMSGERDRVSPAPNSVQTQPSRETDGVVAALAEAIRGRALSKVGRCHRCAFLRQEHRADMGHRIEDLMTVSAADMLVLLDTLTRRDAPEGVVVTVESLAEALATKYHALWDAVTARVAADILLTHIATPATPAAPVGAEEEGE